MNILLAATLWANVTLGPPADVTCTWYGQGDGYAGKRTASGDIMRPELMRAASNDYPMRTRLVVCANGECALVMVNDRMAPQVRGVLDLTPAAFGELAKLTDGVVRARAWKVN